jgi:hypothetical protein
MNKPAAVADDTRRQFRKVAAADARSLRANVNFF